MNIQEARERTAQRVAELRAVFEAIVASSDAANLDDEHDPEGATVGFERAQVSALLERARAQLAELDAASDRVERGDYGACEHCGKPIPAARLSAQPAARACVTCAGGSVRRMGPDPGDKTSKPGDTSSTDDAEPESPPPDPAEAADVDEIDEVDEAGMESFPASDPPAWNARA